jgi:uncharacterized membrane protein
MTPRRRGGTIARTREPASSGMRLVKRGPIWLFVLAHFLVLGVSASARHLGGHSSFYDLGVMDNIVWQTIHGRLFFYPQYGMSYFGDHFAPILFLFVPLYAIWAHPLVLILGQALALALGGLFVHRIAIVHLVRERADGGLEAAPARRAVWALTLIYALHPSLLHVAMFDFHPVALMIPLSLAAYYCYLTRTWFWLVVSLALLATCQEEAPITVAAFGLYMLVFGETTSRRWLGAATSLAAGLYFGLVMEVIIPAFQPNDTAARWLYLSRYAHLGGSMHAILQTIVLHPLELLVRSFAVYKLENLLKLLLPLGLLPLLGWRALLVALPSLAYTYLSARPNQFVIRYQYFSPALGWLMVSTIQGLSLWLGFWGRQSPRLMPVWWRAAVSLPLAVAFVAATAVDAFSRPIRPEYFRRHPYREDLDRLHRMIGREASLSVTSNLAPFFAHRRQFVLALDFTLNRELNAVLGIPDYHDTEFHLFDLTDLRDSQDRERRIAQLLADERYGVRYYRFPLVLFQYGLPRGRQPELEALISGNGDEDQAVVRVFPAVFLHIQDASSVERDLGDAGRRATLHFIPGRRGEVAGPGVILPAGSYAVDFYLELERTAVGSVAADLDVVSNRARTRHAARRLTTTDFAGARRCQPFTLSTDLSAETADLEFRTRSHGAGLSLCKIVVRRAARAP